jgi:hypothetical protein
MCRLKAALNNSPPSFDLKDKSLSFPNATVTNVNKVFLTNEEDALIGLLFDQLPADRVLISVCWPVLKKRQAGLEELRASTCKEALYQRDVNDRYRTSEDQLAALMRSVSISGASSRIAWLI